ncbi:putative phage tail fiber protein [Escherichia coli]|uniref:prophage tail fiber N-terminal domain-containing protein n=1 Tax=Escherichia coli TaxID=562 RepID=UPI000BE16378|nr:prophage tail fiber N-terminal domain-containing protein [Escherichia coli]UMT13701.1 phage tail protein [Escherichia coli]CAD5617082.1 putative phage tail fiber protein [Escherichia coli]CAD5819172.1 putative phage tail fiber protein [Escherichia coli]CAD6032519.1 putative phage tail fiber protein [Escherichia coli]
MSVVISGALTDGAGIPMSGCHIILKSRVNTSEVVMRTVADVVTGNCGEYCFKAQTGKYCVYLKQDWCDEYCVGDIAVYDDSKPGTLNDFLTALDEGDLKPDVVKRFEELVAQAQQSAEAAAESEQQAGQHAADAQKIKEDCQALADDVQQNAGAVAEDRQRTEQLASETEKIAAQVKKDAASAENAAAGAEQAKNEIDTALATTLKTANHLSEIAAEGEEAQQASRDHLGLKSAATMEPQSDIRDRTEGRLAIPGAHGFGHIFLPGEVVRFNSEADFLAWIRYAEPGEYFVDAANDVLPGGNTGMIRIRWLEAGRNPPLPSYTAKAIIFYGTNGQIYYNRYWSTGNGYLIGWENMRYTDQDVITALYGGAYGSTDTLYYRPGSLILAAYNGRYDTDPYRNMMRGNSYPGSRLSAVELTCYGTTGAGVKYNDRVSAYVQSSGVGMPGTWRALSGNLLSSLGLDGVIIGLFIRVV